jgi:hypothetical protein
VIPIAEGTARVACASNFWTGRSADVSRGRQLVRSDLEDIERCLWFLKARYVRGVEATGHRGVVRAAHARIFEEAARMPRLGSMVLTLSLSDKQEASQANSERPCAGIEI